MLLWNCSGVQEVAWYSTPKITLPQMNSLVLSRVKIQEGKKQIVKKVRVTNI